MFLDTLESSSCLDQSYSYWSIKHVSVQPKHVARQTYVSSPTMYHLSHHSHRAMFCFWCCTPFRRGFSFDHDSRILDVWNAFIPDHYEGKSLRWCDLCILSVLIVWPWDYLGFIFPRYHIYQYFLLTIMHAWQRGSLEFVIVVRPTTIASRWCFTMLFRGRDDGVHTQLFSTTSSLIPRRHSSSSSFPCV